MLNSPHRCTYTYTPLPIPTSTPTLPQSPFRMRPIRRIPNLVLFLRSPYALVICPRSPTPLLAIITPDGRKTFASCKRSHYCIPGLDCMVHSSCRALAVRNVSETLRSGSDCQERCLVQIRSKLDPAQHRSRIPPSLNCRRA